MRERALINYNMRTTIQLIHITAKKIDCLEITDTSRKRGICKKTWIGIVVNDLNILNLIDKIILDKTKWERNIHLIDPLNWNLSLTIMMMIIIDKF